MKLKYLFLSLGAVLCSMMVSCSKEEPFSTAGPDDNPQILSPTFPDREKGELPIVANYNCDQNFTMEVVVTPSEYTTVTWFLDGKNVFEGTEIDIHLLAGEYNLKIVATTIKGKSTYREGIVLVNPFPGDPIGVVKGSERYVIPGTDGILYGENLYLVSRMTIGDLPVEQMNVVSDTEIDYLVPELPDGNHRVVFYDAEGNQYGGGLVIISSGATVLKGADRFEIGGECVLEGVNLTKVASLTLGDTKITDFTAEDNYLYFTCPTGFEEGEYILKGENSDGTTLLFAVDGQLVTEKTVHLTNVRTLWSGHHYVSWDFPDDDPNKTFNLIPKDTILSLPAGSVLTIYYSIEPSAEYHQLDVATGWWTSILPGGKIEFSEDGSIAVTLTQDSLDLIAAQDGFIVVGHGYYVDLVTVQ